MTQNSLKECAAAGWQNTDKPPAAVFTTQLQTTKATAYLYWLLTGNNAVRERPICLYPDFSNVKQSVLKRQSTQDFQAPPAVESSSSPLVLPFLLSFVSSVRYQCHVHLRGLLLLPPRFIFYMHFSNRSFDFRPRTGICFSEAHDKESKVTRKKTSSCFLVTK